jgi:hypothetical protein
VKTHHSASRRNVQRRAALRKTLHLARLRGVADAILVEYWTFWQAHHVDRETIEYTLRGRLHEEQRRDPFGVSCYASSEELTMLAKHAYEAQQSQTTEGAL